MKEPTVDSGSSSLKRKHPPTKDREPPPMKKAKKSKLEGDAVQTIENHKQLHKKKGKGKEKGHSSGIEFKNINARMSVTIPPLYSGPGRPHQAVLEMLDGMLMHYVPSLQGVLLAHSNLEFLSNSAVFIIDSPFAKVDIAFTALVWSPTVGSKLWGTISICSPDHIGLLVHKTFNASIPRHHIPTDDWEFEYGSRQSPDMVEEGEEETGRWVHKATREDIGGDSDQVHFTIIGLSLSHGMLSLLGSLQDDPFSPSHVPQPAVSPTKARHGYKNLSMGEEDSVAEALNAESSEAENFVELEGDDNGDRPIHEAFAALGAETDLLHQEVEKIKARKKKEKKLKRAADEEGDIEKPKKKKKLKT